MLTTTYAEESRTLTTEEILDLVREFEACTLPRERWTHAAHLTVALWYLLQYSWPEAVNCVRDRIKRYNEACGVITTRERGYHETLTVFWLWAVRSFLDDGFNEGCALPTLVSELTERAGRGLPLEYYSRERLFSWEARTAWVEPDLKPLNL